VAAREIALRIVKPVTTMKIASQMLNGPSATTARTGNPISASATASARV
jgi:hypothetical protein